MVMPVMDGSTTIAALKRINPEVRIIATSGLNSNRQAANNVGTTHFLNKPFTAETLLIALRRALEE